MEEKLVSIVTITYNAEKEIGVTVTSVKKQKLTGGMESGVEHLIVDGASKDKTLEIARREGREDVRIVSEKDKGLYDAMNKGLHLARGKYVLFLNAGDTFHSDVSLAAYLKAAEKNPDIIYGDTDIVDSERRFISPRHLSVPERLTRGSFKRGMLVCHQAFMVRRALAPDYDLSYRFSADYDWEVKCISSTSPDKCVNLHRVTIDYLSDGLTDNNKLKSLRERFEIMKRHYGVIPTVGMHLLFVPRMILRKVSRIGKAR